MERTLDQMIESNTLYNKSFKPVNEKLAFEERAKLRQKLDKAYDRLKFKRQEERSIVGDVLQAQARQKLLADEESGLVHAMGQLQQRREEANASIQVGQLAIFLDCFRRRKRQCTWRHLHLYGRSFREDLDRLASKICVSDA